MMKPGSNSSHRVIGVSRGQDALLVQEHLMAWHGQEDNEAYLGYELAQPKPDDRYSPWQYEQAAIHTVNASRQFSFPLDRQHILGHEETAQGKRNGKSDPGKMWDWGRFMKLIELYAR